MKRLQYGGLEFRELMSATPSCDERHVVRASSTNEVDGLLASGESFRKLIVVDDGRTLPGLNLAALVEDPARVSNVTFREIPAGRSTTR